MTKKLNPETDADKFTSKSEVYYSDLKLIPIAQKSKELPEEKFCNLLHHVTEERISKSICKIKNNSASGPDEISKSLTLKHLDWMIPENLSAIHNKNYNAPESRRVFIPKSDGGKRPLGIGNILDRGIQGAVREVLEHIYEQDFLDSSFGFRPGRGCHNALATLNHTVMNENHNFLLEVDLENFFGTINHGWLMKFLGHRIRDKRILKLIESWLKAGVMEEGKLLKSEVGTAQGGAISPLLANIFLHYVLDLWYEKLIKPRLRGSNRLIRYADDFIVAFKNENDRDDFKKLLKVRLEQFGLKISEKKTHETNLGNPYDDNSKTLEKVKTKFVGKGKNRKKAKTNKGLKRRHISFLGFTIFKSKTKSGKGSKLVFKTDSSRLSRGLTNLKAGLKRLMHSPLDMQARYLNSVIRGHCNYYGLAGNSKGLQTFHYYAIKYWRRSLSRRSQNGNINWEKMNKILEKAKIVKARIKIPYPEIYKYAIV
jgi:group II intron reverse transcriptase/maturase